MTYHRRKPKPRKWPWVLLALAIVGALLACEALSQPPYQPQSQYAQTYQSNAAFPVLDWAVPHYPNRPVRNTVRYWCGLPPLRYELPPSYPQAPPLQ